jgi:AcrR family transcriptional regulator
MARWAPDADQRLATAALGLFESQGFEVTTVAEIASVAGVTERTFFRYFPTKEDVLFSQGHDIENLLLGVFDASPWGNSPFQVITHAIDALATHFESERPKHRQRYAVISASPSLSERELLKRLRLAALMVEQFERRGVGRLRAEALAGTALTVFNVGYTAWATDDDRTPLAERLAQVFNQLQADLAG